VKKYSKLSELLQDYRVRHSLTQLDLATNLDIDVRTINRWEQDLTQINLNKEEVLVDTLSIPHQVIHNLNSENPISIYYDFNRRIYSHSAIMTEKIDAQWFKNDYEVEEERISFMTVDSHFEFVQHIKKVLKSHELAEIELLKNAAQKLPELNLVLKDQAGFIAGHISILPLKLDSYLKIKSKTLKENELTTTDLASEAEEVIVFYFYSIYADNIVNSYYLVRHIFEYFREHEPENYLFSGLITKFQSLEFHNQLGLKKIWEDEQNGSLLMEGNLDMFLFGKMK